MLPSTTLPILLLTSLAHAEWHSGFSLNAPMPYNNYPSIRAALHHPLQTKTLNLTLWSQPNWLLRINLTEVSIPPDQNTTPNATGYITTYDLRWPDISPPTSPNDPDQEHHPDTLHNAMLSHFPDFTPETALCLTTTELLFPSAIVNRHTSDARDQFCGRTLGKTCLDAIAAQAARADEGACDGGNGKMGGGGGFGGWFDSRALKEACGGVFEGDDGRDIVTGGEKMGPKATNSGQGSGLAYIYSGASMGRDPVRLAQERTRLHFLVLRAGKRVQTVCTRLEPKMKAVSGEEMNVVQKYGIWAKACWKGEVGILPALIHTGLIDKMLGAIVGLVIWAILSRGWRWIFGGRG